MHSETLTSHRPISARPAVAKAAPASCGATQQSKLSGSANVQRFLFMFNIIVKLSSHTSIPWVGMCSGPWKNLSLTQQGKQGGPKDHSLSWMCGRFIGNRSCLKDLSLVRFYCLPSLAALLKTKPKLETHTAVENAISILQKGLGPELGSFGSKTPNPRHSKHSTCMIWIFPWCSHVRHKAETAVLSSMMIPHVMCTYLSTASFSLQVLCILWIIVT